MSQMVLSKLLMLCSAHNVVWMGHYAIVRLGYAKKIRLSFKSALNFQSYLIPYITTTHFCYTTIYY